MENNRDLYQILELEKHAQIQDGKLFEYTFVQIYFLNIFLVNTVKASYYRLAKVYHPDHVREAEKAIAQEKFTDLHLAYSILADPEKKKVYDAGNSTALFAKTTIAGTWMQYIQTIDSNDIQIARNKYQGSIAEQNDIMREIVIGKGSMVHLMNTIPFMRSEDEMRIIEMIKVFMMKGKIPKITIRKMPK